MSSLPQEGLVAVVKRDCPTCELTAPVLAELAALGVRLRGSGEELGDAILRNAGLEPPPPSTAAERLQPASQGALR